MILEDALPGVVNRRLTPCALLQARFTQFTLITTACVVVLCIAIPFVFRSVSNNQKRDDRLDELSDLLDELKLHLEAGYERAISATMALSSFVHAATVNLPNHTSSKQLRLSGQNFLAFNGFATSLMPFIPSLKCMQLQPSGVINQVFPVGCGPVGLDLLYVNQSLSPSLLNDVAAGSTIYLDGPRAFVQGGFGFVLRQLVYNISATTFSLDTWWGTVAVLVEWGPFLKSNGIMDVLNSTERFLMLDALSQKVFFDYNGDTIGKNASTAGVDELSCVTMRLQSGHSWVVCASLSGTQDAFSTADIATICFLGTFVPLMCAAFVLLFHFRSRVGTSDSLRWAPMAPPVVVSVLALQKLERLWSLTPSEMEFIRGSFAAAAREASKNAEVHVFEGSVGSFTFACRTPQAAVEFALAVDRYLREHPLQVLRSAVAEADKPRQRTTTAGLGSGESGPDASSMAPSAVSKGQRGIECLKFVCIIHMCQAGLTADRLSVMIDNNGVPTYEGSELLKVKSAVPHLPPNLLVLTSQAAAHFKWNEAELMDLHPLTIRGEELVLKTVIFPGERELWEARFEAALAARRRQIPSEDIPQQPLSLMDAASGAHNSHSRRSVSSSKANKSGGIVALIASVTPVQAAEILCSKTIESQSFHAMEQAFENYTAILNNIEFSSMKTACGLFFSAFYILFRSFAEVERRNIFRRLVSSFGVPSVGDVAEHLAVRCAMLVVARMDDREDEEQPSVSTN